MLYYFFSKDQQKVIKQYTRDKMVPISNSHLYVSAFNLEDRDGVKL